MGSGYFIGVLSESADPSAWTVEPGPEFHQARLPLTGKLSWDERVYTTKSVSGHSSITFTFVGKVRARKATGEDPFLLVKGVHVDKISVHGSDPKAAAVATVSFDGPVVEAGKTGIPISEIGIRGKTVSTFNGSEVGHVVEYNSMWASLRCICDYMVSEFAHGKESKFAIIKSKVASGCRITIIRSTGMVHSDSDFDPRILGNHLDRSEVLGALFCGRSMCYRASSTMKHMTRYVCKCLISGDEKIFVRLGARSIHHELLAAPSVILRVPDAFISLTNPLVEFSDYFAGARVSKKPLETFDKITLLARYSSMRMSLINSCGIVVFDTMFPSKVDIGNHAHRYEILCACAVGNGYCTRYSKSQKSMLLYSALQVYDSSGEYFTIRSCCDGMAPQPNGAFDHNCFNKEVRGTVVTANDHTDEILELVSAFVANDPSSGGLLEKLSSTVRISGVYNACSDPLIDLCPGTDTKSFIMDALINDFSWSSTSVFLKYHDTVYGTPVVVSIKV